MIEIKDIQYRVPSAVNADYMLDMNDINQEWGSVKVGELFIGILNKHVNPNNVRVRSKIGNTTWVEYKRVGEYWFEYEVGDYILVI